MWDTDFIVTINSLILISYQYRINNPMGDRIIIKII